MIQSPQFLIAKYTPDLRRAEPRNIGVIVWSEGNVYARFAGESKRPRATVTPPAHLRINSKDAYRKWVRYWRELINRPTILSGTGQMVERTSKEFVDALQASSKPQYRLVRGGEFMKAVRPQELPEVANELFEELVAVSHRDKTFDEHAKAARLLKKNCEIAIEDSGLKERLGFRDSGIDWLCEVGARKVPFHFDYAIHYGKHPVVVMDKVHIWKPDEVHSTAFEFLQMQRAYNIPQEDCAALIYPTENDESDANSSNMRAMLSDIATVIDMRDPKAAAFRFRSFGATLRA